MNEAPAPAKTQGASGVTPSRKFSSRSTATAAQQKRILEALRVRPHSSYELRRDPIGSYQCPTRIFELRQLGFNIDTSRIVVVDDDGFIHPSVALYTLVSEPLTEYPLVGDDGTDQPEVQP